jgi:hypothetical protein
MDDRNNRHERLRETPTSGESAQRSLDDNVILIVFRLLDDVLVSIVLKSSAMAIQAMTLRFKQLDTHHTIIPRKSQTYASAFRISVALSIPIPIYHGWR